MAVPVAAIAGAVTLVAGSIKKSKEKKEAYVEFLESIPIEAVIKQALYPVDRESEARIKLGSEINELIRENEKMRKTVSGGMPDFSYLNFFLYITGGIVVGYGAYRLIEYNKKRK